MPSVRRVRPTALMAGVALVAGAALLAGCTGAAPRAAAPRPAAPTLAPPTLGPAPLAPPPAASSGPSAAVPQAVPSAPAPTVAPLGTRIGTDVLVLARAPLDPALVRRLSGAAGARRHLLVESGRVRIGTGRTTALAADPSTFRAWTPQITAGVDPVWQSIARGEGAVAHEVAKAFDVRLGGELAVTAAHALRLRVGSFAATALPSVGLVVDPARGQELGLTRASALLLSTPGHDPVLAAAAVARVLGRRGTAEPVQVAGPVPGSRRTGLRWGAPVVGRVTSPFGQRINPLSRQAQFHEGLDIGAPLGAPVYAMSDGVVLYAGPAAGFGTEVILQHADGVTTVYGHVSRLLVTGGRVKVGQPVALVGSEGESTGPHLHVEVRVDDRPVDPLQWLAARGVQVSR